MEDVMELGSERGRSMTGDARCVRARRSGSAELLAIATIATIAFAAAPVASTAAEQQPLLEPLGGKLSEPEAESEGEGRFGSAVALSGDGTTAIVGAPSSGVAGTVSAFARAGSSWVGLGGKLTGEEASAGASFGHSVALSANGQTALIGAPQDEGGRGAVFVFTRSAAGFSQLGGELTDGEPTNGRFGRSVALSANGQTALIGGARARGGRGATAWVFTRSGSSWTALGSITVGGEIGAHIAAKVALSENGETALLGGLDEARQAAAWVFTRSGEEWIEQAGPLTGSEESSPSFAGSSFALSGDGDTAVLGVTRQDGRHGAAWVFTRSGASWAQQAGPLEDGQTGDASRFGNAAALSSEGDIAVLGAPAFGAGTAPPGASFLFSRTATSWTRGEEALLGAGAAGHALFGKSVALSGDGGTALVGAPRDGRRAGAAWFFTGSAAPVVVEEPPEGTPPGQTSTSSGTQGTATQGTVTQLGTAGSGVLASNAAALPPPKLGLTGNLRPISGTVLVKLPGSHIFVPLTEARQVPFGTVIDATAGMVALTTARLHGGTQTMTFYAGRFKISQGANGVVLATLTGGNFSVCPTRSERHPRAITSSTHASSKHVVRKLWAEGHGSYSTKGNYATGAVLGTRWLTEDRCDGTLIHVATDRVRVTNLRTHHHLNVTAGHSYLAKAP